MRCRIHAEIRKRPALKRSIRTANGSAFLSNRIGMPHNRFNYALRRREHQAIAAATHS